MGNVNELLAKAEENVCCRRPRPPQAVQLRMLLQQAQSLLDNAVFDAVHDIFSEADTGDRGKLTLAQLDKLSLDLQARGFDLPFSLASFDLNHTGDLDWTEFEVGFRMAIRERPVNLLRLVSESEEMQKLTAKMCQLVDTDGNGRVSLDELVPVLEAFSTQLEEAPPGRTSVKETLSYHNEGGRCWLSVQEFEGIFHDFLRKLYFRPRVQQPDSPGELPDEATSPCRGRPSMAPSSCARLSRAPPLRLAGAGGPVGGAGNGRSKLEVPPSPVLEATDPGDSDGDGFASAVSAQEADEPGRPTSGGWWW